jgi:Domain of unknown function (DUF4265)
MTSFGSRTQAGAQNLTKVRFELNSNDWHGYASETLWAERVSEGRYRIRNIPFYAHGICVDDVVFAGQVEGDDTPRVSGVSIRSGHSTYRIFVKDGLASLTFTSHWKPLEALGCTFESAKRLLAVDVPARADIYPVYKLLEAGESQGVWEFEEGHCGHPLKDQA